MKRAGVIVLGAWVMGCGAPAPPAVASPTVSNDNLPPRAPEAPTPSPSRYPTERIVLIDGARAGRVVDTLDGFQLVHGAGTVALVGPDGHVRASHRFAFGADGASAVLIDTGHALVGNVDHDGFRGPWAGGLDRWTIDTDTMERLVGLGYVAPLMARLPGVAVVLDPTDPTATALFGVRAQGEPDTLEAVGDRLVCASEDACFVVGADQTERVRVDAAGHLTLTPHDGPVTAQPSTESPSTLPSIGARGLPVAELAPTGGRLLLGTSSSMVVLGPEGIGSERTTRMEPRWGTDRLIWVNTVPFPLEAPTLPQPSVWTESIPYPLDIESEDVPEMLAFSSWQDDARAAQEEGRPIPRLDVPPVCAAVPPVRCVRAHLDGSAIDGWELFDPARPTRVLGRIAGRTIPPGAGYVAVGAGGRWVRDFIETTTLTPLPRGTPYTDLVHWVELAREWVFTTEADGASVVHYVPADGRPVRRTFSVELTGLGIVDADHVLAVLRDGSAEVLSLPNLLTTRTLSVGAEPEVLSLHCENDDLVDQTAAVVVARGCPVQGLEEERGYLVRASADRAFWLDARLGDEVLVHRRSDGARLSVRVTTVGVLVSGPGGVFEATGEVADHVVVREPGPVRTAPITAGAEARARFERPGLVAAFFAGRPLPTP